jgi:arylsulfatase A-like enzyme
MSRRFRFSLSALIALWLLITPPAQAQIADGPGKPPNVILLVLDATRTDHLSSYGCLQKITPRIDEIAAESTLYEQCIAAAPWTLPSVASLMTGLFPHHHGVNCQNLNLRDTYTTLAERLRDSGYQTAAYSGNPWVGSFSGMAQGFDVFEDIWRGLGDTPVDAGAAEANRRALEWIDSLPGEKPFFLYIHYMEPHFPYRPPRPFDRAFQSNPLDDDVLERVRSWRTPRELGYILKDPNSGISPDEMRALQVEYKGEIGYLDSQIGALVDALTSRNLLGNTLLVITADHGEHLGDHQLLDHKFSVYENLIRIPLIIRYPEGHLSGTRVKRQVQNIDLVPTVIRYTSRADVPCDGTLLPRQDDPNTPPRTAFTEFSRPLLFTDVIEEHFPMADYSFIDRALLSLRTERYKLIWASNGRHALYDLSTDPGEQHNLIDTQPEIAKGLLEKARSFQRND